MKDYEIMWMKFTDWIFSTRLGYLVFMIFFQVLIMIIAHMFFDFELFVAIAAGFIYPAIMLLFKKDLKKWY